MLVTTDKVIRIGGQSKSEVLMSHNLKEVKIRAMTARRAGPYVDSNYFHFLYEMDKVRDEMTELFRSIQQKTRQVLHSANMTLDKLKETGIISDDVCQAFKSKVEWQQQTDSSENLLEWWIGWNNHRKLLKILRELKLSVHGGNYLQQQPETAETEAIKDPQSDDGEAETSEDLLEEDLKIVVLNDDDDEEDQSSRSTMTFVPTKDEEDEPGADDFHPICLADEDHEVVDLIDWAKNQMERMKNIREHLASLPAMKEEEVCIIPLMTKQHIMSVPLHQRWLIYNRYSAVCFSFGFID